MIAAENNIMLLKSSLQHMVDDVILTDVESLV